MTWKKSNPMPRNRDRLYVTARETAIWAVKGTGWVFNRQRDTYENGFLSIHWYIIQKEYIKLKNQ